MKKTLLTALITLSLVSLFACQTARVQTAKNSDNPPAERAIAQAPAEGALEAVFKSLASTAQVSPEAFDAEVIKLVNANPAALKIGQVTDIEDLKAKVGDNEEAFLKRFSHLPNFGSLNIKPSDIKAAALQEVANTQTIGVGSTLKLGDIVKTGPVSADSFKAAADADPQDVKAIINHAESLKAKNGGHDVVTGGCENLRSPASIHNLQEVVTQADANLPATVTQAQVDTELQNEIAKVTGADAEGAHERLCELADSTRCGVLKVDANFCEN